MEKRKTFALTLFIRRTLSNAKGLSPIFLRITANGSSTEMRIQRSITEDNWSVERCMAKGRDRASREINDYIDTIKSKALQIHRELELDRKPISAKVIKDLMQGKGDDVRTIKQIFEEHNAQIKKLESKEFSPITVRRYEKSLEVLLEYIKYQYKMDDMPIVQIDPQFIDNYMVYLKANYNLSHNTAVKRLKNLKKVIRIALMNGWITIDPFRFTKLRESNVEKEFLVKEEIERIIAKDIKIPRLAQVRDIYLFCAFTGLAFTDVSSLRPEHIIKDNNGDMWIRKTRQKTKNMCNIPLLEIPLALIEKYKEHEGCLDRGTVLPVISNQRLNSYLKELADICGIDKHLTSHTARYSFATLSLTSGISIESVAKMLGHANIRMTQHYAKILDTKINDEMDKLRGKFAANF
ncbi:MAG: site-specific integrase [Rikenellaceae bacterium]